MMSLTRPEFHFRPNAETNPTTRSSCCDVVDVCVNKELLQQLTDGKQQSDCFPLIRLHWDKTDPEGSFLSSVTPYQRIGQSKKMLGPTYAVALATQSHILQDFTCNMLTRYGARLVCLCYKPLVFTFNHGREFDTKMFTTSTEQLTGLMKSLVVKCDGTKDMQLSLKIGKGTQVDLPQIAQCGCLQQYTGQDKDGQEKTDIACQATLTANCSEGVTTGHKFANRIEERFVEMEKRISDHKKMIRLQFIEQKRQNEAIKMHILRLSKLSQEVQPSTSDSHSHSHSLYEDGTQSYKDLEHGGAVPEENVTIKPFADSINKSPELESSSLRHGISEVRKPNGADNKTETVGVVIGGECVGSREQDDVWSRKTSTEASGSARNNADEGGKEISHVTESITFDAADLLRESENDANDDTFTFKLENGHEMPDENKTSGDQPNPKVASQETVERVSSPLTVEESKDEKQGQIYLSSQLEESRSLSSFERNDFGDNVSSSDSSDASDSSSSEDNVGADLKRLLTNLTQGSNITSYGERLSGLFQHEHDDEGNFLDHYMQAFSSSGLTDMMGEHLGFQVPTEHGMHPYQAAANDFSDYQNEGQNFEVSRKLLQTSGSPLLKTKVRDEQDGEQRMHRQVEILVEGTHNKDYLMARFNDALNKDDPDLPYANSAMDTVFCLDTSASVNGDSFYYMKRVVLDYVTEVEDIAERYEIEENLALVTFGEDTKIVQPLSNDYGNLRDTLEEIEPRGHSPMLEGVLTAIACMTKGGELSIKNRVKLPPRLIIFTDGLATGGGQPRSTDVTNTDPQQINILTKAFDQLRRRQPQDYWHGQIVIVPVGRSNMSFLLTLARNSGGMLVDGTDVAKLGNIQRIHKMAANSLEELERETASSGRHRPGQRRLMLRLSSDIPQNEQEQIRDIVEEYKDTLFDLGYVNTFCNVQEVPGLPTLGSRVTRGADWKWRNQDTEAAGTIFNHELDGKCVWVIWDNSHRNVYRWGRDECFDVQVVHDKPRDSNDSEDSYIGLQVKRGDGWNAAYGDQDGGAEETGVIIRERQDISRVLVKWQNGRIYEYRFGENNVYDVEVINPKNDAKAVEEIPLD